MTNKRASWLVVAIFLVGCGGNPAIGTKKVDGTSAAEDRSAKSVLEESVINDANAELAEARELSFLRTYELEFIHDVLREKVELIDRLARGRRLPVANTVEWCEVPPSANNNTKFPSYAAKWSSHSKGFYSLQRDDRPGAQVHIHTDVDPENTKLVRSFSLWADSQSEREGWDAHISLFSWRPYRRSQAGAERLWIALRRSEETSVVEHIEWPFNGWYETLPEETQEPLGREIAVTTKFPELTLEQIREALASPERFRDHVRHELEAAKRRSLDDIAAGRNLRIIEVVLNPRSGIERQDEDPPTGFNLSAKQKQGLENAVNTSIAERIALFNKDFKQMHAAIMQAFPIDKYLASERN